MEEGFHGNLDARAQEFRPSMLNPNHLNLNLHLHQQHQQLSMYTPTVYFPSYSHPPFIPHQYSLPPPQAPAFYAAPPPPPIPPVVSTPSRTLLLSSVPVNSSESLVLMELQAFGEVRALEMERLYQGIVTVHFYDLRHAQRALTEIRQQHMHHQSRFPIHHPFYINNHNNDVATPPATLLPYSATGRSYGCHSSNSPPARGLIAGCAVWAQYVVPMSVCFPDGNNQGTIVLFNLDSSVSTDTLKQIFESFGPVKELRETPMKRRQKFVEFYDIRDAAKALEEMNGKEIHGRNVVIEFSRPGGYGRRLYNSSSSYNCSDYQTRPPPPSLSKPFYHHHSKAVSDDHSDDSVHSPPLTYFNTRQQRATKKQNSFEGKDAENKDGEVEGDGLKNSMASLGIIETRSSGSSIEERNNINNGGGRSFTKRGNGNYCTSSSRGRRSNKLSKQKNLDSRFLINEDAILESSGGQDSRTTVMIKNIPNKYSQKLLLNMLDNHCINCNEQIIANGDDHHHLPLSSYDFVYLPIDFNNKCNVGYGFVNMTSPEATLRLYKAFHLQSWEVFNSRKICEVTYARVQGLEALKEHFKNSKFPSVADEIFPVVFEPPRDGKTQTEPLPIYGITSKTTNGGSNNFMMTVTATSKAAGDEDHHHGHNHHHGSGDKPFLGLEASSSTSHNTTEADELEGEDWIDNDGYEDDDTEDRLGFGNDENNNCRSSDA